MGKMHKVKIYPGWLNYSMFLLLASISLTAAPIADNSPKFLGNIVSSNTPPSNFADYWNQVTLENGGKWGSVQNSNKDNFSWTAIQGSYDYCKSHGFLYKQHCFVWGSQYPSFMNGMSSDNQKAAIENWIKTYGEKFPETDLIDVVNEATTTACSFKNALGGDGTTGWDWVVTAFELARKYCPNSKLLINDYDVETSIPKAVKYLSIVKILQQKNLVDGIGVQSHCFNIQNTPVATLKKCLDTLASSGLPIYSSEFDIVDDDDQTQLADYKKLFPVFWEHPAVKGITLWGWTNNWKGAGGAIMKNNKERPALTWMRTYIDSLEKTGVVRLARPGYVSSSPIGISLVENNFIRLNVPASQEISMFVFSPDGRVVFSMPNRFLTSGEHLFSWPEKSISRGVYVGAVKGASTHTAQKLIIGR